MLMSGGIWTPLPPFQPVQGYSELISTSITPFFHADKVEKAVFDRLS